ncbi:hypothetical protein, partial [Pseudomonas aeruginosa]|uniref:hypothetical protein n=1 Tax=Pseudomonas aeruginosa TaxID=287 RepID=UPI003969B922
MFTITSWRRSLISKRNQAFARAGIVVSLPGNRDTLQRSRDLKHQHAAIGVFQLMDFTEGDARFRIFRNLHLQRMQAFGL